MSKQGTGQDIDLELPTGTAPSTAGQTFRRGGFKSVEQVEAEAAPHEAPPDDPVQAAAEAEEAYGLDLGLPETPEEQAPEQEEATTEVDEEIQIGDKSFRTQKEAFAYAQELEREKLAADAFRQGVEAAQYGQGGNQAAAETAPAEPEQLPTEYFTNPAKYLADRDNKVVQKAVAAVTQQQDRVTRHNAVWNEFYNEYADLQPAKRIVDAILQENWDRLQHVDTKIALKEVAGKARQEIENILGDKMPKQVLPKTKNPTTASAGRTVTTPKQEEKTLNFVGQQKSLKTAAGRAAAKKRLGL